MPDWYLLGGLAAGAAFLASRGTLRRRHQEAAADAAGLVPVGDLTHLPESLQRSALWALADGGFESRVVHGALSRGKHDLEVTAFDLETLRERRGEWAYLPVQPPFRIGGTVSIVVCEIDRVFPHVLFKRDGRGDALIDDDVVDRATSIAKLARGGLGMPSAYPAEMPGTLSAEPLDLKLPDGWRVYGDPTAVTELMAAGLGATLDHVGRRDLVIELLDALVIVYPAARDVVGADAFADLTWTALAIADGVLACSPALSPRGVE
ncbi:MAG TPA: hypothetical protein VFT22_40800 [Kofleriaceae bacterium]|nr:hypothetical protein [Kofleriaceae bacterium]